MLGRVIGGVIGVFLLTGFLGAVIVEVLLYVFVILGIKLSDIPLYSANRLFLVYVVISCVISFFWLYSAGQSDAEEQAERMKRTHEEEIKALTSQIRDVEWERDVSEAKYRERAEATIAIETQKLDDEKSAIYQECNNLRQYNKILKESMLTRATGYKPMYEAIAKLDEVVDNGLHAYLIDKSRPALSAADTVKRETKMRRVAEVETKTARSIIEYYEQLFPDLVDIRQSELEGDEEEIHDVKYTEQERQDPVTRLLAKSEYDKLSPRQRSQLALDRYWKRRHSPKELGRMYERYVGYLYESKGYSVEYSGINRGLEDLGRDLVCRKGKTIEVVQCKYWSQYKNIFENRIFQHFGTTFEYKIQNKGLRVIPVFYTTTKLSDTARKFTKTMKMKLVENHKFDKSYPCIKCNIGRDGSKIYHLPFDQQYDKVNIEPEKGEFFAKTVKEAEDAGFRRAYRWRGAKS